jgi:hypothetical protein
MKAGYEWGCLEAPEDILAENLEAVGTKNI